MTTWQQRAQWIVPTVVLSLGATALVFTLLNGSDPGKPSSPSDKSSQGPEGSRIRAAQGVVLGTVLKDGKPVQKFKVGLYNGIAARGPGHTATTDASGRFRFVGVAPNLPWLVQPVGTGDVTDTRRNWTLVPTERVDVTLPPDSGVGGVVLEVAEANSVTGRLVDGGGRPLPGIDVIATRPSTDEQLVVGFSEDDEWARVVTDAEGRYQLGGLPDGEWTVRADQQWATPGPAPVGTLAGEAEQMIMQMRDETAHRITVALDEPADLAGGEQVELPDLVARSGRVLTGRVRDATGAVVPGAQVTIVHPKFGSPVLSTTTDAKGRYRFIRLKPGRYTLGASSPFGVLVFSGDAADLGAAKRVRVEKDTFRTVHNLTFAPPVPLMPVPPA